MGETMIGGMPLGKNGGGGKGSTRVALSSGLLASIIEFPLIMDTRKN